MLAFNGGRLEKKILFAIVCGQLAFFLVLIAFARGENSCV
jgi:hypothetical protein